jgi:hypothetical protein
VGRDDIGGSAHRIAVADPVRIGPRREREPHLPRARHVEPAAERDERAQHVGVRARLHRVVDPGAGHGRGQPGVAVGDDPRIEHEVRRRQLTRREEPIDRMARPGRHRTVHRCAQTANTVGTIIGRRR